MIRRSLELKKTPKHLSMCMQCYKFIHDIPGESSAFAFEHMCDGVEKDFDMLQKAKSILELLPIDDKKIEADKIDKTEGVKEIDSNKRLAKFKEAEKAAERKDAEGAQKSKEVEEAEESKKAEGAKKSKEDEETERSKEGDGLEPNESKSKATSDEMGRIVSVSKD